MCIFSPCQRERKVVWNLKYQKYPRSLRDGYGCAASIKPAPSCTFSLLMLEVPTRHPPMRGACHQLPQTPHSCRARQTWDGFWAKTSSGFPDGRSASLHERECLQGLFPPVVFKERHISPGQAHRACCLQEMFIFLRCGQDWAEISAFLRELSYCQCCTLVTQGDILLFPWVDGRVLSLSPTGNGRRFSSFWPVPQRREEVPLTGVTGECCDWSWSNVGQGTRQLWL